MLCVNCILLHFLFLTKRSVFRYYARARAIKTAAALTASYSDSKEKEIIVRFGVQDMNRSITASKLSKEEIEKLRIK